MTSFMIFQNAEMGIIFLQKAVANLSLKSNIMTCVLYLTLDQYAYALIFFSVFSTHFIRFL